MSTRFVAAVGVDSMLDKLQESLDRLLGVLDLLEAELLLVRSLVEFLQFLDLQFLPAGDTWRDTLR